MEVEVFSVEEVTIDGNEDATERARLARWGDALESFATLTTKAVAKRRGEMLGKLAKAKSEVDSLHARLLSKDDDIIGDTVRHSNLYLSI